MNRRFFTHTNQSIYNHSSIMTAILKLAIVLTVLVLSIAASEDVTSEVEDTTLPIWAFTTPEDSNDGAGCYYADRWYENNEEIER